MFSYFVDALVHPRHHLPPPNQKICLLLSLAVSWTGANDDAERTLQLSLQLQRLREILDGIYKLASVSKDYQEIKEMMRMIQTSQICSICCLRWMECVFQDSSFYSRSGFLTVQISLLQCIVNSIKLYPLQHSECLNALKAALLIRSELITDQMGYIANQKIILDCFAYLIHLGFVFEPLEFVMERCHALDTGSIRHFIIALIPSMQPPFSELFVLKIIDLLNNNRYPFLTLMELR